MRVRRFEREQVREPGSGGGSAQAADVPILDDVQSLIADLEKESGGGGQGDASKEPAPGTAPAAAAAAATAASAKPTVVAPPATSTAKQPYTLEELSAFEGNFDRRDFDWDRVPAALQPYAKHLASGTGKARSRLRNEVRAELEAEYRGSQPAQAATNARPAAPEPVDMATALDEFLNPETTFSGLEKILSTDNGKQMLERLGYASPVERAVVSDIVQERVIQGGLLEARELFPQLITDESFLGEVREIISQSPKAMTALRSRDPEEVAGAFMVGSAHVVAKRQDARDSALTARETSLNEREASIAAKEANLTQQIEATNRAETTAANTSVRGGGERSSTQTEASILDDVKELGGKMGMFTR